MAVAIRQVSEVVIQVLSMLLHCSLQVMESSPAEEELPTPMQEVTGQFQTMLGELQHQRSILETMMEQVVVKKNQDSPHSAGNPGPSTRQPPSPSKAPGLSEASWEVLEDEEILAQSLHQAIQQRQKQAAMTGMPTSRPSQAAAASSSPPTTSGLSDPVNQAVQIEQTPITKTPLPPALALWGTKVINWGKKHKGHMYSNVRIEDPGYVQWLIQRFGSLIPEQKDYVSYVRAMTTWDQQGLLNLREILP